MMYPFKSMLLFNPGLLSNPAVVLWRVHCPSSPTYTWWEKKNLFLSIRSAIWWTIHWFLQLSLVASEGETDSNWWWWWNFVCEKCLLGLKRYGESPPISLSLNEPEYREKNLKGALYLNRAAKHTRRELVRCSIYTAWWCVSQTRTACM